MLHQGQSRVIHSGDERDDFRGTFKSHSLLSSRENLFRLKVKPVVRGLTPWSKVRVYDTDFRIPGAEKLVESPGSNCWLIVGARNTVSISLRPLISQAIFVVV